MLLAVDIGNTNITFGFFNNNILLKKISCKHFQYESFDKIFKDLSENFNIKKCLIASVVDELTLEVNNLIEKFFTIKPIIINYKDVKNLNIISDYPEKIGIDRIINACAAKKIYSKFPAIVVDIGTATTFDIIDKKGDFIGGLILPGINTQLKSLADNTSKLPKIEPSELNKLTKTINIETKSAVLSGVIKGHAYAIEGLLEDCEKELKEKPFVIATGGNAELVSKYTKNNIFNKLNPDLTLEGINFINSFNY